MSVPQSRAENDAVVLVLGLLTICGLLCISLLALGAGVWVGAVFGLIELGIAWRVSPPRGARPLRWTAALVGAFTVIWALLRFFVS